MHCYINLFGVNILFIYISLCAKYKYHIYNTSSTKEMTMNVSEMTREQLEALVHQQEQANKKNVVVKVSQKGCVQINGIRRFPITFYKNEWEQIFAMKDEIVQFIEDNDHLLAKK